MRHAAIMVAIVALFILYLQTMVSTRAHRLGGGDPLSHPNRRSDAHVSEVDIGQGKPKPDDGFDREAYPEVFASKGAIVSFKAAWCGPCRKQATQLKALEREFRVVVYDIDEEKGKALYEYFKGEAVPTTLIVEGGEEKKRWVEYVSAPDIEQYALPARKVEDGQARRTKNTPYRINFDRWTPPALIEGGRSHH